MTIKRGEIYYIQSYGNECGSEQRAGRPAIIVSNDKGNQSSSTVEVVYLTTQPKHDLPTHVVVRATGKESIALCEQVHTVAVERIGDYCGECSKNEMQHIDIALLVSLALDDFQPNDKEKSPVIQTAPPAAPTAALRDTEKKLLATEARLSLLQTMYTELLQQITAR